MQTLIEETAKRPCVEHIGGQTFRLIVHNELDEQEEGFFTYLMEARDGVNSIVSTDEPGVYVISYTGDNGHALNRIMFTAHKQLKKVLGEIPITI